MRKLSVLVLPVICMMALIACGGDSNAPAKENSDGTEAASSDIPQPEDVDPTVSEFDSLLALYEDPKRDAWQKPENVLKMMGQLDGKVVAEIGAGSGYFTYKLANVEGVSKVIATDIDQRFLDHLEQRKEKEPNGDKVEIRKVEANAHGLGEGEVDCIFMSNVYSLIRDRVAFMSSLKTALKPGGVVFIMDFKKYGFIPYGPGAEYKPNLEQVKLELEDAGFTKVRANPEDAFEHQYLLKAAF